MTDRFRLEVFAALAESGSFSAAARQLGISQPAVSQNIAELEKYAGGKLFARLRGGVSLTRKGRDFLRHVQAVLDAYARLDAACKAPNTILLKGVSFGGVRSDVLIDRGLIADLDVRGGVKADKLIDAHSLELFPSYCDSLCLAADRFPLSLRDGCGFVSFASADPDTDIARIEDLGIRAALAVSADDKETLRTWESPEPEMLSPLVDIPDGCREDGLCRAFAFARKRGFRLRISAGSGVVEHLESLHLLGSDVFMYGCSSLRSEEWKILSRRRVNLIHCPTSDYRRSGLRFPYESAITSDCRMLLGTGDSRHSIAEELRTALLLSSVGGRALDADTLRSWATVNAAEAFGLGSARFCRGGSADFILASCGTDIPEASNISYLVCNGRIIYSAPPEGSAESQLPHGGR